MTRNVNPRTVAVAGAKLVVVTREFVDPHKLVVGEDAISPSGIIRDLVLARGASEAEAALLLKVLDRLDAIERREGLAAAIAVARRFERVWCADQNLPDGRPGGGAHLAAWRDAGHHEDGAPDHHG
jgi:hypothetical protein